MDCDLYADLELSGSEKEDDNSGVPPQDTVQAEMDLMDEGLTSKFKPVAAPKSAPLPRVDIEVEKLKREVASLKEQNETLLKNLVLLYKTSHHVHTMKEKELNNLRTKYDAMCFRRRDPTNSSALPSIAPRTDHQQNTDARVPDRPLPAPPTGRQVKDHPKRPAMTTELSLLKNYARMSQRSHPEKVNQSSSVASESVGRDDVRSSDRSSDQRAHDTNQESRENFVRKNADGRSVSPDDHHEDTHRRARHSERDKTRRGNPRTARKRSRSRSPTGSQCREEPRNDRKRLRGSSDEEHGAKRSRNRPPELDRDTRRHRSPRGERKNLAIIEEAERRRPRSGRDKFMEENVLRNRRREPNHRNLVDTRRALTRSRRNGEANSPRRDGTDCARASDLDIPKHDRADPDRARDERLSEGECEEEHTRASRRPQRERSAHDGTRRNRSQDHRRGEASDVHRNRNANSSSNGASDRESSRKEIPAVDKDRSALRNTRVNVHKSERMASKRFGHDGAARNGGAHGSRNLRQEIRERAKRESRERDNNSNSGGERDSRRLRSASPRRKKIGNAGRSPGADSLDRGTSHEKRCHVPEAGASPKSSRDGNSDVAIDKIACFKEDNESGSVVGGNERSTPNQELEDTVRDRIPEICTTIAAPTCGQEKPPDEDVTRDSKVTLSEDITKEREEDDQDAASSRYAKPADPSKPTFKSETEVSVVQSETPTRAQVNKCDSPKLVGAQNIVNSTPASTLSLPLRRSPRKSMKSVRHMALEGAREGDDPVEVKQECESVDAPSMELRERVPTPTSFKSPGAFMAGGVELRRSPRKSVRDRQVLNSVKNTQFHGVIESPHVVRASPTKLNRRIPLAIPMELISVGEDPRVCREALRPLYLNTISYPSSTPHIESNHSTTFSRTAATSSSPRRSPRKLQAKRLTEGDAVLLQSLMEQPKTESPKFLSAASTSFHASPWLDDSVCDLSKPPDTPGKNIDFGELSPRQEQRLPIHLDARLSHEFMDAPQTSYVPGQR